MKKNKELSSNMEDYLEAINSLEKKNEVARVSDISRLLNVRKSSVVAALNHLSKHKLVVHDRYSYIKFTSEGKRLAEGIQRRHSMLLKFLTKVLDIDPRIATEDACGMEHSVSPSTLEKLTKFIGFVETCPAHDRPDWLKSFDHYFKTGRRLRCKVRELKDQIKEGE